MAVTLAAAAALVAVPLVIVIAAAITALVVLVGCRVERPVQTSGNGIRLLLVQQGDRLGAMRPPPIASSIS